jgi:hypothetical protein
MTVTLERATTVATRTPGGRAEATPGLGWAARDTGQPHGWVFYRAARWRGSGYWETYDPDLPYGIGHITDRDDALGLLARLADTYGDRPLELR